METMKSGGDCDRVENAVRNSVSCCPSVVVAYLFGSALKGRYGPLSDVDVGVLLDSSAQVAEVCGSLQDALCRTLGTNRIDLISLAQAPSSLAYRVIRDGRCVCCRDSRAREAFESDTVMHYLDFKPVRDQAFHISRKHILETV